MRRSAAFASGWRSLTESPRATSQQGLRADTPCSRSGNSVDHSDASATRRACGPRSRGTQRSPGSTTAAQTGSARSGRSSASPPTAPMPSQVQERGPNGQGTASAGRRASPPGTAGRCRQFVHNRPCEPSPEDRIHRRPNPTPAPLPTPRARHTTNRERTATHPSTFSDGRVVPVHCHETEPLG
jgi:hypothetical protein